MKHITRIFKQRRGFTLLELLIVISIIAILIGIATVSYSTAQKKSRDAKRRADMKSIQNAFEQYNASNGAVYSATCSTMATGGGLAAGLPHDPQYPAVSDYTCNATTSTYCSCTLLEGAGTGNSSDANCSYGSGNYFCVSQLQ